MKDSAPSSVSVELDGISHRFGRRLVFSGVEADVVSGGVLVIAGANGSGKSTLLRIVAGLLHPTSGSANLSMNGQTLDSVARRPYLGYVAPDLTLYRELTGAENIQLFAKLRGAPLERDRLAGLLERVGLKGRGRDYAANYSSGMRQRLKYAFALLHEPPLLLLDEPSANLDAAGADMVKSIVEEQRRRGISIVATNDEREVNWGDSVVRLSAN